MYKLGTLVKTLMYKWPLNIVAVVVVLGIFI